MGLPLSNRIRRRSARQLTPPSTPWSPTERGPLRVLLECPPEGSPTIVASALDRAGFDVVTCEGPSEIHHCPVNNGEHCDATQRVDAIVNMLGNTAPSRGDVLGAIADSGPRRAPIVAILADPMSAPPGVVALSQRATGEQLVSAVYKAVESAGQTPGAWGDGV